jgi:5'(3')-deoxyribonucleotidase
MNKVIALDVDGVLADFVWGFTAIGKQAFGGKVVKTPDHMGWNDFPGLDKNQIGMIWDFIKKSRHFWRMLNPCVPEIVFDQLQWISQNEGLYFVTNRPGDTAKQQTEGWLRDHGISNPTVIISGDKGYTVQAIGAQYYIDDKAGNAVFAKYHNRDCNVYLLDRPYNRFDQTVVGTKVRRVDTVEQFLWEAKK